MEVGWQAELRGGVGLERQPKSREAARPQGGETDGTCDGCWFCFGEMSCPTPPYFCFGAA